MLKLDGRQNPRSYVMATYVVLLVSLKDYVSPPPRVAGTARGTTAVPLRLPHVDAVELRLLLVAERVVEFGQRSRRRLERLRHCAVRGLVKPPISRVRAISRKV